MSSSLPKSAHFFPIFSISSAILFTFISFIPLKFILLPPMCITLCMCMTFEHLGEVLRSALILVFYLQ